MAQGPLGPPKLHLVANVQFWQFATGPVKQRLFFSKLLFLAQMLRNVTKAEQNGSGSLRSPKTALGWKRSILAIYNRSGPVKQRPFFSKLLCLAQTLRNVTKVDQHGSGSRRSPKTALGCTLSILAIRNRSGPVKQRPFFSKLLCLARMLRTVTKTDQHGSGSLRSPKTALGWKRSILVICNSSGPVKQRPFFSKLLCPVCPYMYPHYHVCPYMYPQYHVCPYMYPHYHVCVHTCTPANMCVHTCTPLPCLSIHVPPLPCVSIHVPPLPCVCPNLYPHYHVCPYMYPR